MAKLRTDRDPKGGIPKYGERFNEGNWVKDE